LPDDVANAARQKRNNEKARRKEEAKDRNKVKRELSKVEGGRRREGKEGKAKKESEESSRRSRGWRKRRQDEESRGRKTK